ncbi:hypothetical protein IWX90DRAFT_241933 [Phyllosticta citrichinensis]|uniref:Uncharacterized protein n=1 Tax=Phyllosticta citrichinensis TaxID=1130410 RepID=A0ABR1XQG1_9PEZI
MLPPRPPRQEGPVRELPRRERSALTRGPKATIELLLTDDGTQRAVVECPRNALKAFSNLASQLLVSDEHTNLQIPPGNVALGALRYIMAWIPRTCEAADFMPIKRKDEFKQNVLVYQAALYLEITEILTTIGGLLNMRIDSFERAPWSFDDASYVILTLPRDCGMVNRLIEKMALTRRRNNLDQVGESPQAEGRVSRAEHLLGLSLAARLSVQGASPARQTLRRRGSAKAPPNPASKA